MKITIQTDDTNTHIDTSAICMEINRIVGSSGWSEVHAQYSNKIIFSTFSNNEVHNKLIGILLLWTVGKNTYFGFGYEKQPLTLNLQDVANEKQELFNFLSKIENVKDITVDIQ